LVVRMLPTSRSQIVALKAQPVESINAPMARWRVNILRRRGQYLGIVEAPDAKAAVAAAIKQFNIAPGLRFQITVQRIKAAGIKPSKNR
jgi:hypothetical protein